MKRIRKMRLVLPARFAQLGPAAARDIAERFVDASYDQQHVPNAIIRLHDTGQTSAQIGLQAARATLAKPDGDGGGT